MGASYCVACCLWGIGVGGAFLIPGARARVAAAAISDRKRIANFEITAGLFLSPSARSHQRIYRHRRRESHDIWLGMSESVVQWIAR